MLLSVLLAATPAIGVPANADRGLPCAVHQQFLALGRGRLEPTAPLLVRFDALSAERWRLVVDDGEGRRLLTRELANACAEIAPLAVAIVERYLTSVALPPAQLGSPLKLRLKAPPPPPMRPSTEPSPPRTALVEPSEAPTPEEASPNPSAAPPLATSPLDPPSEPAEPPRVPLEIRRTEPTPSPRPSIVPALGVGLWWETSSGLAPTLLLEGKLQFGAPVHLALLVLTRWPTDTPISLPEGRQGTLSVWSSNLLAAAGACLGTQTRLCGDGVIGARLAIAGAAGALYQRREAVLLLPTAGLRAHASIRLSRWLLVSLSVLATVPWGRSSVSIEGTSASYATPFMDLTSVVGLQLAL